MEDDSFSISPVSVMPTDDLIQELAKRCHTVVVLMDLRDERERGSCVFHGNFYTAIGLLESYKNDLIHFDLENASTSDEP